MSYHILRYGTNADKKFIDQNNKYYDLLAINGNMLAYTPGALAGFIRKNLLNESILFKLPSIFKSLKCFKIAKYSFLDRSWT